MIDSRFSDDNIVVTTMIIYKVWVVHYSGRKRKYWILEACDKKKAHSENMNFFRYKFRFSHPWGRIYVLRKHFGIDAFLRENMES